MDKVKSNKNIKKKIAAGILWVFITLLYIPVGLTFLSNQPLFQTFSARMATMLLSNVTGYDLSINSIDINIFKGVEAGGLSVYDTHNNIMLKVGHLSVIPVYADWKIFGIMLHEVKMDSLDFRLGTYRENDTLNFVKFIHSFSSDTSKSKSGGVFKLKIKKLILTNSHFELFHKYDTSGNGKAMDYSNMDYSNINLNVSGFKLYNDSLNFKINNLSTIEKSGLNVKKLSTDFILSGTTITAMKLKAVLNNSGIDGDVKLIYRSWKTMSYFNDSVQLYGKFANSSIDLSDIGYFADVMNSMKNKIQFRGLVKGTVNNLYAKNFYFKYGDKTTFSGDLKLENVTDFDNTIYKINFDKFTTDTKDIVNFKLPGSTTIEVPDDFLNDDVYTLKGTFYGNYFDFNTSLNISQGKSEVRADVTFEYKENDTVNFVSDFNGYVDGTGRYLNLGNILGKTNFSVFASGNGNTFNDILIKSEIVLKNSEIKNYQYDSLHFAGTFHKDTLQGNLSITDPNLILNTKLNLGLTDKPYYDISANFGKAHFKKLKLIEDDFSFKGKTKVKIKGNNLNTLSASFKIDSATLAFVDKKYYLKKLSLDKYDSTGREIIRLKSDFIDADVEGKFKLTDVVENTGNLLQGFFAVNEYGKKDTLIDESFNISANLKDNRLLSDQFLNGVRISPESKLKAYVSFKNDSVNFTFNSNLIKSNDIRFKDNLLSVNTRDNKLLIDLNTKDIILKDSTEDDPTKMGVENFNLQTSIADNLIGFIANWTNTFDTLSENSGKIQGYLYKQDDILTLSFDDVLVYTNDTLWTINKNNKVVFDTSGVHFENFTIKSGMSSLTVKGAVPKYVNDSLNLVFDNWNLAYLNPILKNSGYSIDGLVNGGVEFSKQDSSLAIISDIRINNFGFNKVLFGDLRFLNTWDDINKSVFIKLQVIKKGKIGVGEILSMEGFYFPFKKENSLDISTRFNRLNIAFLNPVLRSLFHNIKGKAKGEFIVKGSLNKPDVRGKVKLERTSLVINYLNTKYSFSNFLTFNDNKINFNNIIVYDTLGNSAKLSGNVTHKFFSEFSYDFNINTDKFLFVNTTRRQNELYYGTAMASGNIHMWGDPKQLNLKIETKTAKGTDLSIPLDQVYSTGTNDYIKFVPPPVDSLSLVEQTKKEFEEEKVQSDMAYNIDVKANVTPDARVNIYLPADLGKIESSGHGILNLKTSSESEFTMIGDYEVDKGNYIFNFKNLISKRFDLVKGGKITWTGDPTDAYINIKGLYKVKASLSSLGIVVDSTAEYKNKQTVNCYIILKNKLLNPEIKFSITLPDADPDIQRLVFSNLDTTNPAMVNEQMISLLVFGSFSFTNATNYSVAGQGYNILTNQLSSMLSKISKNFDIGMNYRPGDEISQQEFEVALSTQLFNDRLIIDGNVGMTYDRAQKNASNIVGDVDIMYKLTQDGRWLLKAYNHSNANSWYYYNNYDKVSPYTQGVGIAYRKEFNNIKEFFRRRGSSKNKNK